MRTLALAVLLGAAAAAQAPTPIWLDTPLMNWNVAGSDVPRAVFDGESLNEVARRCGYEPLLTSTAGERALGSAGWIPFRVFDRQIVSGEVEIIGGLAGATACAGRWTSTSSCSSTAGLPAPCRRN